MITLHMHVLISDQHSVHVLCTHSTCVKYVFLLSKSFKYKQLSVIYYKLVNAHLTSSYINLCYSISVIYIQDTDSLTHCKLTISLCINTCKLALLHISFSVHTPARSTSLYVYVCYISSCVYFKNA